MRHLLTKWSPAAPEAFDEAQKCLPGEAHLVRKTTAMQQQQKAMGCPHKKANRKDLEMQTWSLDASLFAHICLLNTFQFNYTAKLPSPYRTIVMLFRFFQVSVSV